MKDKKFIIILFSSCLFSLIYLTNQNDFLSILVNPTNTEYAKVNDLLDGYMVEDDKDYEETAYNMDQETDFCVIFIDEITQRGVYTSECSQKSNISSESVKFDGSANLKGTVYYDTMYEYLYMIKDLTNINELEDGDYLPRYNNIYVKKGEDITKFLPPNLQYFKLERIYTTYNSKYAEHMTKIQTKVLSVCIGLLFIYIFYKYINNTKQKYGVYQLLGVKNISIFKILFFDYFLIFNISFFLSLFIYLIIVFFNGKIFYLKMFFEYFSLYKTSILYLELVILSIPIALISIFLINSISLEKRLK